MPSKLADALRARRIFNNYGLLRQFGRRGDFVVEYCPPPTSRSVRAHRTKVWSLWLWKGLKEPDWRSSLYGTPAYEREFIGMRDKTLPQAKEWAWQTFKQELLPSPFGGYVSARLRKAAEAFAKGEC